MATSSKDIFEALQQTFEINHKVGQAITYYNSSLNSNLSIFYIITLAFRRTNEEQGRVIGRSKHILLL